MSAIDAITARNFGPGARRRARAIAFSGLLFALQ